MGYQLIETIEVGAGGAASIEFTGIPQDGVDLQVVIATRSTVTNASQAKIAFNGTTGVYTYRYLRGSGSAVISNSITNDYYGLIGFVNNSTSTANTFTNYKIYLPSYTSSLNKSYSIDAVSENNASEAWQTIVAGIMNNTAAITSILLTNNTGNFAQYSTASLYKITAD